MNRMRLSGLIRKEFLQIVRDPSAIAIAVVLPFVLLLLFGYGISLDARRVPLALVAPDSPQAQQLLGGFYRSPYFMPRRYATMSAARNALARRRVDGIVWLRSDFGRRILGRGDAGIGVFVNGVDANNATLISAYIRGVWSNWLAQEARDRGAAIAVPVEVEPRIWFNAALRSRNYLVPGLIAIIMTLIGALLTAQVVSREWERGTMEALMATPVSMGDILFSKLVPYFGLGMAGLALSVAMAEWLFSVPLRGSMLLLFTASGLYMLVALGMGLLISTVAKNQFVSATIAVVATFLPAFILSGFIFDLDSMPFPIRLMTHLVAARYFVAILQTVFGAGDVWPVVLANAAGLCIMAVFFLGLSWRLSRKRLD